MVRPIAEQNTSAPVATAFLATPVSAWPNTPLSGGIPGVPPSGSLAPDTGGHMNIKSNLRVSFRKAFVAATIAVGLAGMSIVAGATAAHADTYTSTITAGTHLQSGDGITSGSGQFHLGMQSDGNLVLTTYGGRPLWSSKTSGAGNYFAFQGDDNLVVYSSSDRALWTAGVSGTANGTLSLQNDGNLLARGGDNTVLWATYSGLSSLRNGESLQSGFALRAGAFKLAMQSDGNLVELQGSTPIWSTNTGGNPGGSFRFQTDGSISVVNSTGGTLLWSVAKYAKGGSFGIDSDGIVYLADSSGNYIWQNRTVATTAQAVAQKIVNLTNSGKITWLYSATYQNEIVPLANTGKVSDLCLVDLNILKAVAMTASQSQFSKVGISDLNRSCIGGTTNCTEGSLHCTTSGVYARAMDVYSINGVALNGANSQDLAYLHYVDSIVPSGSQAGQLQCRPSTSLTNITRQFNDTCNHQHVDLGDSTGSVDYNL